MKVSLNWLRELVELPPTVGELVDLLTLAGVEVEGVETSGCAIGKVVVARIDSFGQHPNADRLSVCQVDDGSGTPRQIVCGAKNFKAGDKVPLALPGDFTIKIGKLRGVESQGMLCSGKELNLSADSDGLLILSPEAEIGAPIGEVYPSDTVLDLEITPNRADLLSVWGIAAEIAALTGKTLQNLAWAKVEPTNERPLIVGVETDIPCYYSALLVEGAKVEPSPAWLRGKLEAVGLRPINNAVDLTNYMMLYSGQPCHVFDAAKVQGSIRVRTARAGEKLLALDGKSYALTEDDLVIADEKKAMAIAGVMGGEESGVTDQTRDVILEIANFDPAHVRRTARRLQLSSDSSYRFERGVDMMITLTMPEIAGRLLAELTGAAALHRKSIATKDRERVNRLMTGGDELVIPLREERVRLLLGTEVSAERITQILTSFRLVKKVDGWKVPTTRRDLTREIDLIEEIARVVGMDEIPAKTQARFAPASATDRAYDRAMNLRRAFAAQGLHEARSLTLVPAEPRGLAFTQTAPESLQRVKNPMIDDQVVLRPNLLHGLLAAIETNIRAGAASVRLFEVGRVFSTRRPEEFSHAAVVLTGPLSDATWRSGEGRDADLFDLKGLLGTVLGEGCTFKAAENPALALALTVEMNDRPAGFAGQLWPADARALDAASPVVFAEIDLGALDKAAAASSGGAAKKYRDIPRFPATTRDIALLAPLGLTHEAIEATLLAAQEPLLASLRIFDVFTDPSGAKVPADKKSLAYSLTYRAADRTLTTEEVNAAHARLKQRLTSELGVTLRE